MNNRKIINLSLGEPSASLPYELKKMLADKIFNTRFGYTESIGITNLRKAIARHYKTNYKIEISYKNIDWLAIILSPIHNKSKSKIRYL